MNVVKIGQIYNAVDAYGEGFTGQRSEVINVTAPDTSPYRAWSVRPCTAAPPDFRGWGGIGTVEKIV